MTSKLTALIVLAMAGLTFVVGCGSQGEPVSQVEPEAGDSAAVHDPHDIPLTEAEKDSLRQGLASYEEAVGKIKSYRDAIQAALAAGSPPEAHRPLDELDIVLEHLPTVARDNNVPRTEWETVNTSAQQLRESFNQVHAKIDAGEEPDFQAVASNIDAAIERLEAVPTGQ
jgi:hypothetical protein